MKSNKLTKFKRTEIGMIPSDWVVVLLGNNIEIQRGGSPRPIEKYLTDSIDGVNWIKIGDTNPTDKYIKFTNEKITKEGATHSREVHKGEFLLSNSMSYGRPYILNIDGYIHDGWLVLRHFEETFNVDYLYYYLSYDVVKNQYDNLVSGSGVKNLNKDIVKKVIVAKPPKPEQEKIANVLTRIDNLIEDYEKLIKKKEKIKQGLMQNLLTGKVRLKGFDTIYKNDSLGNVCEVRKGKQINGNMLLNKGKYYMLNGGQEASGYLNEYNTLENTISISEGGNSCGYVNYNKEKFWAGGHLYVVDRFKIKMDILYFYYLLKYNESSIMQLRKGSGLPNIQKSDLMNFEICLTNDIKEQQAISQVLSNADNEINDLKIKLNKIIDIKKGMLDNLLTGRIRL